MVAAMAGGQVTAVMEAAAKAAVMVRAGRTRLPWRCTPTLEWPYTRTGRNMTTATLAATAGGRSGRGRTWAAAVAMAATTAAKDRPTGVALVKDPRRARRGWGFICRSFVPGWGALLAKQHRLSYIITRSFCGRSKVEHTNSGRFKG